MQREILMPEKIAPRRDVARNTHDIREVALRQRVRRPFSVLEHALLNLCRLIRRMNIRNRGHGNRP